MFRSIRWRFIIIYFLLVFLAMAIVGVFITLQLKEMQLDIASKSMKTHILSILQSSTSLQEDNWSENTSNIKESISSKIQIGYNENVYIILNDDKKTIIASSVNDAIGIYAYESKSINNYILEESLKGSIREIVPPKGYDGIEKEVKHMAYPAIDSNGSIKGIIYLTYELDNVDETIMQSKIMLTKATIIALLITIVLGFIIASGITGPIKDLTLKAKEMSKGDFNQKVDVKSNDEIGQLGNMFNYLTSELKKNISEVYKEKSKIETTLNYMADGVLAVDINGDVIHANPVAKKILTISDEDEKNKKYNEIIDIADEDLLLVNIKNKNWEGSSIFNLDKDTYKINYAPFKDDRNEIGGVIFVIQDITEQYKLDQMQKEFVANVSHELKTPITTIKSYAETLLEGALENREITEDFLKVINSESDRMARIVSDLLKLSRMDYNQAKWNKVKLNPNSIVTSACRKLRLSANNKNIDLMLNTKENIDDIVFDVDALEQLILNILSNAIKYTPENGKIEIDTYEENNSVVISVKDSGIGIPEKDLERIFDRFYRVDKARTRELGGTGLGLSIAKHIADEHNSLIEVESKVDIGTLVKIVVPK